MKKAASALIFALAAVFLLTAAARAQAVVSITSLDASSATWTNNPVFVFGANFGLNNVASVCARWDNSPTYTFNGADTGISCGAGETSWASGTQSENAVSEGQWYFHAEGFDSGGAAGTQEDVGPFGYDVTAPAASSFATISSTGGPQGEGSFNNSASVPTQITLQDANAGLAVSTYAVSFLGDGHDDPQTTSGYGVIYSTDAGNTWIDDASTATVDSAGGSITSMAVFNGKIYAGDSNGNIYVSADGTHWANSSGGPVASDITSLVVFNEQLYAGDNSGNVYAFNGTAWNSGANIGLPSPISSLAVFNNKLIAASSETVSVSADGASWSVSPAITSSQDGISAVSVFKGKLYALDEGNSALENELFVSTDGFSWSVAASNIPDISYPTSLTLFNGEFYVGSTNSSYIAASSNGTAWSGESVGEVTNSFTVFNGKLYAASLDAIYVLLPGSSSWIPVFNNTSDNDAIAAFNGRFYTGDNSGKIYQLTPNTASLTGSDGTTSAQTLSATLSNLANSTNTSTCGGSFPCNATNQVIFTGADRAGNAAAPGPYAILVDIPVGMAISTPTYPSGNINVQPNFDWKGPSTSVVAGLSAGANYELQVSKGDSSFGAGNIVLDVSTPAVVASTMVPTADGAYLYGGSLSDATTYYWRVRTIDGNNAPSDWSATTSFATDFTKPSASSFVSIGPAGQVGESQFNSLTQNVTAQIMLQDSGAGLAVSTDALSFAGDGHDDPQATSGFGVMYSTDAGQSWIDDSATSTVNSGIPVGSKIMSLAQFDGSLYAGDWANGKIYDSADGNSWNATNSGVAVGVHIRPLAVFNGKLYAGDASNGNIYASANGNSWITVNGGAAVGSSIQSLAAFDGRLYAGDFANGNIYVSADGNSWTMAASQSALGSSSILPWLHSTESSMPGMPATGRFTSAPMESLGAPSTTARPWAQAFTL